MSNWIIGHFPKHHSYVEPYFGSGAVFFNKPRSDIETINDLDSDIVNLFDCIRKDPERLAKAVYLTPYSREVYERAYAAMDWCRIPERIIAAAERLRGVQIEHMDALELIERFNFENVLIYCDPPYVLSTRHGKQYKCEMSDTDHIRLLELLMQHKGSVVISGYDSELYNNVLAGWHKESQIAYSQVASQKQEVIWMNFKPVEHSQMSLFEIYGGINDE